MAELREIIERDIPNGRKTLIESHANLKKVADFCEGNYLQAEDKKAAVEETRAYTTHALASVAYHINTLATNFLSLLDLQATQLSDMDSSINHLAQTVDIHKEKVARREIGVLTTNKTAIRPPGLKASGIIFPETPEKATKFIRKPVDYTALDHIGHGVKVRNQPRDLRNNSGNASGSVYAPPSGIPAQAPNVAPPNPPVATNGPALGTIGRAGGGHYHPAGYQLAAPAPVNTPRVPSHYMSAQQLQQDQMQARAQREREEREQRDRLAAAEQQHQMQLQQQQQRTSDPYGTGMLGVPPPPPVPPTNYIPPPPGVMGGGLPPPANGGPHAMMNGAGGVPPGPVMGGHLPPPGSTRPPSMGAQGLPPSPLPPAPAEGYDMNQGQGVPPMHDSALPPPPPGVDMGEVLTPPPTSWVPTTYIEKVIAIYDYAADKEDELSFRENALIYVLQMNDDGWYEGVKEPGVRGLFPGNYVEPCM